MVARGQVDLHLHHHPDYHYHYHYHRFHYHRNQHQDGVDPEYLLVAGDRGGGGGESGGGDDEKVNIDDDDDEKVKNSYQMEVADCTAVFCICLLTNKTKQSKPSQVYKQNKTKQQNHHRWRCSTTMKLCLNHIEHKDPKKVKT